MFALSRFVPTGTAASFSRAPALSRPSHFTQRPTPYPTLTAVELQKGRDTPSSPVSLEEDTGSMASSSPQSTTTSPLPLSTEEPASPLPVAVSLPVRPTEPPSTLPPAPSTVVMPTASLTDLVNTDPVKKTSTENGDEASVTTDMRPDAPKKDSLIKKVFKVTTWIVAAAAVAATIMTLAAGILYVLAAKGVIAALPYTLKSLGVSTAATAGLWSLKGFVGYTHNKLN